MNKFPLFTIRLVLPGKVTTLPTPLPNLSVAEFVLEQLDRNPETQIEVYPLGMRDGAPLNKEET